jgi:phosphatidylserine/phosphatidylglycerophosphate/cardiolipin synthase-like enzyme
LTTAPDARSVPGDARRRPRRQRPAIHVKAIAVDGARAYLGSENLSWTSLNENREVGLIAYEPDVLQTMGVTFEKDWAAATPF